MYPSKKTKLSSYNVKSDIDKISAKELPKLSNLATSTINIIKFHIYIKSIQDWKDTFNIITR